MKPPPQNRRLREIDFLRGAAVLLVLFRHRPLFQFTENMGWIGVDLFFVLSGFLVSGVLFKEYKKFGRIFGTNFLARRAFKIYPIFYLAVFLYAALTLYVDKFSLLGFLSEVFFLQNYLSGLGWFYGVTWSLAIEEHFYILLTLVLGYLIKKNVKLEDLGKKALVYTLIFFGAVISLRFAVNLYFPADEIRTFTMTHLRIDSLFAGVVVSYLYYFRRDWLTDFYGRKKFLIILAAPLLISFAPLIADATESFFVKTVGFTLLYVSFGLILICFLRCENINNRLDKALTRAVVGGISRIGLYSYAIYIFHQPVNVVVSSLERKDFISNQYLSFFAYFVFSIILGAIISIFIENFFLSLRDRLFPKKIYTT